MNPNEQVTSIKYDEISKVRKHIMEIHDMDEKLNNLRMIVSENFFYLIYSQFSSILVYQI